MSAKLRAALLIAAEQSLGVSERSYHDIVQLAEAANILHAQELAGDLLRLIRARAGSDAAINGELKPAEVNALVKAYQLLEDYDPDTGPHVY